MEVSTPQKALAEGHVIWLVGMMGVGKSTIAPIVARALGVPHIDSDREIERRAGATISEIFASQGEPAFRRLEAEAIEAAAQCGGVVALGGGAMAQAGAPQRLRDSGTVVYLKATPQELLRRISHPDTRPLLRGLDSEQRLSRLSELLAEREESYLQADMIVEAGSDTLENVARKLAVDLMARIAAARPEGVQA